MPDGEGEDVLLPKRKKPPDIWQITMIDAIIAAHKNATLAEECAAEIAANVAAAAAAAAAATTTMAKITVIKSQTHLSSPLPSSQPPTSIAVAIAAAANATTAAATAAAAVAAIIMAKITDTKSETPVAFVAAANFVAVAIVAAANAKTAAAAAAAAAALSSPLPSLQPPTSIAVAIVAAANYKDHIYAANKPMPSRQWQPTTHQLTHRHFQASGGSHPLFTRDPDCAADGMSTAAQEMKGGLSWELAVAKAESATAVAATTKAAAIKTMAANAPTDPQTLQGFRGIAPFVTGTTVTCDPECAADGMSTAAQEMKGGLSWELAVGG